MRTLRISRRIPGCTRPGTFCFTVRISMRNLLTRERLQVFRHLLEDEGGVVVTTVDGLMDHLLPLSMLHEACLSIEAGMPLDIEEIKIRLAAMGYERMGQGGRYGPVFRPRRYHRYFPADGGAAGADRALGDEVDSIRSFDAESQRSIQQTQRSTVAAEVTLTKERLEAGISGIEGRWEAAGKGVSGRWEA